MTIYEEHSYIIPNVEYISVELFNKIIIACFDNIIKNVVVIPHKLRKQQFFPFHKK